MRNLPQVFERERKPWILPDEASAEEVARVVTLCPTGALRFERHDGGDPEPAPEQNTVQVMRDGPLYLRGDIRIVSPEGELLHRDTRVALCRCGASQNTPFCDDSHVEAGFRAPGAGSPRTVDDRADAPAGSLRIEPRLNDSYRLEGDYWIWENGEEEEPVRGSSPAYLCRCGESQEKPYCDRTHARVGFTAESW